MIKTWGHLSGGVVDRAIRATRAFIAGQEVPTGWIVLPYGVGVGWAWDGSEWTGPDGQDKPLPPEEQTRYKTIVTPAEFVELFPPAVYLEIKNNLVGTDPVITLMYEYAFLKDTINLASPKLVDIAMPILLAGSSLTRAQADIILRGVLEE